MVAESNDDKSKEIRVLQHDGSNYVQWDNSLRIALAQDDASVLLLPEYNIEVQGESFMTVAIKRRMQSDIEAAETQLAPALKRIALKASQPHAKLETPSTAGPDALTPEVPKSLAGKGQVKHDTPQSHIAQILEDSSDDETKTSFEWCDHLINGCFSLIIT